MNSLNSAMAKGVAWMALFKLVGRLLTVISTVILARLLLPADFGLVQMAMSFIAILELLSWFSFDVALIQNQDSGREHYDTAWTFNLLFAVLSAVVLVFLAPVAAAFYQEPRLIPVMLWLALGTGISGLENIGIVNFRKELKFDKEFLYFTGKKLVGFAITIPLAFMWRSYWALIAGMVAMRFAGVLLSYLMSSYRPRFSLGKSRELFGFSVWLFVNNTVTAIRLHTADFVVGRMLGAPALGLFTISFEISNTPTTELVAPINRAVFPGYAKMSGDIRVLRRGYLNVIAAISLFAVPAGIGIAATADLLVPVLLGPTWMEAIPLIRVLALFGVLAAVQSNMSAVYFALGQPIVISTLSTVQLLILVPAAIWSAQHYGVVGVAWSYVATMLLMLPINFGVLIRTLDLRLGILIDALWRPLIGSAVMYFAVVRLLGWLGGLPDPMSQVLALVTSVAVGIVVYGILVAGLWIAAGRPEGAEDFMMMRMLPGLRARLTRHPT